MLKQIFKKALPLLLGLAILLGPFLFGHKTVNAANPNTVNFQGKVVNSNGTNVADGTYSFVFRIYNTSSPTPTTACSSDASCLFEETQGTVQVTSGVFQVELGSTCSGGLVSSNSCTKSVAGGLNFSSNNSLYLTMQFNGDTSGSHGGFMEPLIHLTSVPYAYYADNAGSLGGLSATNFVQLAQGLQTDTSTSNASIAVNKNNSSGTPDILLLQKAGQNVLEVNNSGTTLLGQAGTSGLNGTLTFNNSAGANTVSLSLQADPGSSYTLLLPTTGPSTSQCLQTDSSTANQLKFASCSGGSSYTTIDNAGSALTQRTVLNFTGNGVACADNSGSSRTDCTVAPTLQNAYDNSGSPATIQTSSSSKGILFAAGASNDSTSLFQVQNSLGSSILNTSTITLTNLIANSSFESNTTGWAKFTTAGTETSFTTDTTQPIDGTRDLKVTTTSAAGAGSDSTVGQGAKYTYFFKPNTTYTFSAYVTSDTTDSHFEIGAHVNAADLSPCTGLSLTLFSTSRLSCTFTTGATTTGSDYLFVRRSDAVSLNMYIDSVQLEYGSTASNYRQDVYPNRIFNSDFESNANGWAAKGSATVSASSDFAKFGNQSLKVVTSASTNTDGTAYSFALQASSRYTLSFWARTLSGTATLQPGRQDVSGTDVDTGCSTASVTTTWTNFTCTFTTGSTITPPNTIYIRDTGASDKFYIDGVTLVGSGVAQTYSSPALSVDVQPLYNTIALNSGNTGELGPWQLNSYALGCATQNCGSPIARSRPGSVTANGYIYILGGYNSGAQKTVLYAKLNTDGSVGAWQTAVNSLPDIRTDASSVYANGYVYVIGGSNPSIDQTTVYYAKLNADGSVGAWQTATNSLPDGRGDQSSVVANGYVYVIGGYNTAGSDQRTVYYAKLNADGSVGAWQTAANALPVGGNAVASSVVANGYVYDIGGDFNVVYYAKLNADGSVGVWQSGNALPSPNPLHSSVVANGYVYAIGGETANVSRSTVYYAKLNADGSIGAWQTAANSLPAPRDAFGSVAVNGYVYVIAGDLNGSISQSNVYYTSTSRVLVGGNLDLVGLGDQDLADGGDFSQGSTGGTLTAGNTTIVGSLDVRGQANFTSNVGVNGALDVTGGELIKGVQNSTNFLQVQNGSGVNLINANTINLIANSDFETGTAAAGQIPDGWANKVNGANNPTLSIDNTQFNFGAQSMKVVSNAAGNTGAQYNYQFLPSTQYTLSAYIRGNASYTDINLERQENGSDLTTGSGNCTALSVTTSWQRFSCTFTTGSTIGTSNVYIENTTAASETFWVDDVQLEAAGSASGYRSGDLSISGLVTLQPAASLIAGQNALSQTVTNASSTGGTVNGYNQTITVNNTSSASTTNGLNVSLTDNASALANIDTGLKISLSGSNSSQTQFGIDVSVTAGYAIRASSAGQPRSATCGGYNGLALAICGDSTSLTSNTSTGIVGHSSSDGNLIANPQGAGVFGVNNTNTVLGGDYVSGVVGVTTGSNTSGTSIGVLGRASANSGATRYGGYFSLDSTGTATAGAALYATNSTVAANILQLQNNNVNAMVVDSSGNLVLGQSNTGGANGTIVLDNSTNTNTLTLVTGATAANGGSGLTLTLPTAGASGSGQCLQSGTGSTVSSTTLTFGSCSAGGGTSLSVNGTAVGSTGNLQNTSGTTSVAATTFTNTSGNITLTVAAAGSGTSGIVNATTQTFDGNKSFTGTVTVQAAGGITVGTSSTAGVLALFNGTNAVQIQGATSTSAYSLVLPASAGTTNQCLVNTSTPGTLQWLPCGAGSTATVTLAAEYAGAVMSPNPGAAGVHTGTMTSDFCAGSSVGNIPSSGNPCGSTQSMNYYTWTSTSTISSYDIWVRWQAPSDIKSTGSFGTISVYGWTQSSSDLEQMIVYNSNSSFTSCGTASVQTTSSSFTAASITPSSSCDVSGGQYITIDIHLANGVANEIARAGDIVINYNRQ